MGVGALIDDSATFHLRSNKVERLMRLKPRRDFAVHSEHAAGEEILAAAYGRLSAGGTLPCGWNRGQRKATNLSGTGRCGRRRSCDRQAGPG